MYIRCKCGTLDRSVVGDDGYFPADPHHLLCLIFHQDTMGVGYDGVRVRYDAMDVPNAVGAPQKALHRGCDGSY